MGILDSLFGKSESEKKLQREVAALKASIKAKEKADLFSKALANDGSVWIKKNSGTRQVPVPKEPAKLAFEKYVKLLDTAFAEKNPHTFWVFHMSPAGEGGYYLDIKDNFVDARTVFIFDDGYRHFKEVVVDVNEFDVFNLSAKSPPEIYAEIKSILELKLLGPKKEEISQNKFVNDYDVIWIDIPNTKERLPIFTTFTEFKNNQKFCDSIKYSFEHEIAGALLEVARGIDSLTDAQNYASFRKKINGYAKNLFNEYELENGCDKIDALCAQVIKFIRDSNGFKAAIECNVGAFSLTGSNLHARNMAIDVYHFMQELDVGGAINILIRSRTPSMESLRKAVKILKNNVIPNNGVCLLESDLESDIRPTLENYCEIFANS